MSNVNRDDSRRIRKPTRIRDTDSMHLFVPFLLPNRADNEAFISKTVDMTAALQYIAEKNAADPEHKYTIFHFVTAALAKTIALRPKLNRYYSGKRYYQRNDISFAFVAKKQFSDEAHESLLFVHADPEGTFSPMDYYHDEICRRVYKVKKENADDEATDIISVLTKLPRPILSFVVGILNWLLYHNILPYSLSSVDPYHSSVFITNLGSIKMQAGYHHLTNWGTNSFFLAIGEMKKTPFYDENGAVTMRDAIELGITLDERIADGYYYSKSIRLLDYIMTHPQILDKPLTETVDFE